MKMYLRLDKNTSIPLINSLIVSVILLITLSSGCTGNGTNSKGGTEQEDSSKYRRARGLLIPTRIEIDSIYKALDQEVAFAPPPLVDLEPLMPPALDQGEQGSCAAFVTAYSVISYYEKRRSGYDYGVDKNKPDYSRVFSPWFVFNYLKSVESTSDCSEGIEFPKLLRFIQANASCKWSDFPYAASGKSCGNPPTRKEFEKAQPFRGYIFKTVTNSDDIIKSKLSQGLPVIIGIITSKDMDLEGFRHKSEVDPFYWKPSNDDISDYHAMLCVGYDDNLKCYKLLNSWGREWGCRGYCYVPYNIFKKRVRETYLARINRGASLLEKNNKFNKSNDVNEDSVVVDKEYSRLLFEQFQADSEVLSKLKNRTRKQDELLKKLQKALNSK